MNKSLAVYSIVAALSVPLPAHADKDFWIAADRFSLNTGGFLTDYRTEVRLSSDTLGEGTLISLEDDLGLDKDDEVVRLDGYYRFKPRHRIDFSYFDLSREGRAIALNDIQFGDEIFPAGTAIDSDFGIKIIKAAYSYSFFQRPTLDLGVTAGMYGLDFDTRVTAPVLGTEETEDGFAPFPVFGLRATYAINPELLLKASFEYFEIDESDVEGRLIDILVAIEHKTWKNVGLGVAYNDVDLDAEDKEDRDEFNLKYDGFFLYTKFYF